MLLSFFNPLLIALLASALPLANPAAAAVVVLANRTKAPVTVTLLPSDQPAATARIASGDSQPVFFGRSLRVRYRDGFKPREYELSASNAYFFTHGFGEGALHLEKIGLGKEAPPARMPKIGQFQTAAQSATIFVKLLVDDDEPTHRRIWEARLRKRIAAASEVLQRHSGVRLQVKSVATWDSEDTQHDFFRSFNEFEREVSPKPAQLAIGFSSQYTIARGRVHLGGTRGALYPYILLKERSPNVRETERLELLVHELGHYLGASHSPEPQSVMRPVISGGLQRAAGSRIQFDPVNTLLMAMIGDEIRHRQVRHLAQISNPTKNRMLQIYGVLNKALPDDPAARRFQQLLSRSASSSLVADTRQVLDRLMQVATLRRAKLEPNNGNENKPASDQKGDTLANLYVREAATQAQQLRPENARKAMLLALGIFMDNTTTLRTFPATKTFVSRVEPDLQRRDRLRVLAAPTMRGRNDLAKHFFVSAHLSVVIGSPAARNVGLAKERLDAQRGSGFSFADMAANLAGIVFAERLLDGQLSLAQIARKFSTESYLPDVSDLVEGLDPEELKKRFGGPGSDALEAELRHIERRILELPVYQHEKL